MNVQKITSLYCIIIGISMMLLWIALLLSNQVPELVIAPVKILYHLIAEFLTAILLIISGIGLFLKRTWSFHLSLISLGMLLYTVIVSAGYYANLGDMIMVGMFSLFQILTIYILVLSLKNQ